MILVCSSKRSRTPRPSDPHPDHHGARESSRDPHAAHRERRRLRRASLRRNLNLQPRAPPRAEHFGRRNPHRAWHWQLQRAASRVQRQCFTFSRAEWSLHRDPRRVPRPATRRHERPACVVLGARGPLTSLCRVGGRVAVGLAATRASAFAPGPFWGCVFFPPPRETGSVKEARKKRDSIPHTARHPAS